MVFLSLLALVSPALAQTDEPPLLNMPPMPQGLEPPPTVNTPRQVSQGAQVYYLVCMVCHGDKGQELTDEWRRVQDPSQTDDLQTTLFTATISIIFMIGLILSDLALFIQQKNETHDKLWYSLEKGTSTGVEVKVQNVTTN